MDHEQQASSDNNFEATARPMPEPPRPSSFTQNFAPAPENFAITQPHITQPPMPGVVDAHQESKPVPGLQPQPVVQVLSPRGVEYVFLTVSLMTGALGLIVALVSLVNGGTGFDVLSFPAALLVVSVPVFSWLFLRLKQAELQDPALALDASKRRSTQFIQIVSFLACFFSLISFVGVIFAKMGGAYDGNLFKAFLDVLSILVVAGGILAYYWRDEHKG